MPFQDEIFGKTTYEKRFINDPLQKQIDEDSSTMPAWFREIAKKAAGDVSAMNPALMKEQKGVIDKLLAGITGAAQRAGTDPTEAAKDWSNFQLGNLMKIINAGSGQDSAAGKLMKARLGYAGRPEGSFSQVMRTREIADRYSPLAQDILSRSASDSALNRGQDLQSILSLLQTAAAVPGVYDQQVDAALRPARAAQGVASGSANLLSQLAEAARGNFAGFEAKSKAGIMDYIKAANETLKDVYGIIGGDGKGGGTGGSMSGIMGLVSMLGA